MSDIVTRLRRHTTWLGVVPHTDDIAIEAADEIERLRAENRRLRTALAGRLHLGRCLTRQRWTRKRKERE